MPLPRILVTGATGKTGAAVAAQLCEQGWPVRALVHRIDARSERLRGLGADVVAADLHDPDQLLDALRGMQRAYYVPLLQPHALHAAAAFATAAREARLEAVVQMSQWLSHRSHPSVTTRETWLIDRLFAMLPDTAHVIVNPGMFADNFLRVIDFASLLRFHPVLTGDSRCAPVANEDIARVVVALLKEPQRHAGQRYRPTGPQLLTGREMAHTIEKALGHRVLPVDLPFAVFNKAARLTGAPIHEIYSYREYLRDHRAGAFSLGGGITNVVAELTGTPAETFEATARRYAALPFARKTLRNRLAALARFAVLPLVPGHDLEGYERRRQFPLPPRPTLSSHDARWRAEHGIAATEAADPAALVSSHA